MVLSILHGLAGVTNGVTDTRDRCVALSRFIVKKSDDLVSLRVAPTLELGAAKPPGSLRWQLGGWVSSHCAP